MINKIDVNCFICNTKLFTVFDGKIESYQDNSAVVLCRQCYKEKDLKELTKIAEISSELVIKDLAKIHKVKKEELV